MIIIIKTKVKIIKKYFQEFQNYHININFNESIFDNSYFKKIIKNGK